MSHTQCLLDLKGQVWRSNSAAAVDRGRLEMLSGPAVIITDYQAAPFGVEAFPAHHQNLAPLLEKRLRDEGDIDGLARVILHTRERQGDLAQVCYTAIPLAVSLRYRRWVKQQGDHVLLFPLLEALITLARQQGLENGLLAFVHDDSVDVLVLQDGQVMHASRERLYARSADDQARIATYIAAHLDRFVERNQQPECLLVERRAEESQPLTEALRGRGIPMPAPVLSVATLFEHLSLKRADLDATSRTLYLLRQVLPWAAAAMAVLCLSSVVGALYWKQQADVLQAELNVAKAQGVGSTVTEMSDALLGADELYLSQRERADFVRLAEQVRQTPNPARLLRHLRQSVPADIDLIEAGIISDDEDVLIIVAGRSASVAAPFAAEERFVLALNRLGYEVVRREITSGLGNSLFRLALTWSEQ